MSKIKGGRTVFDVALDRIDYIFDEFKNVIVNFSGGKDSTVTLNLALKVAEKKERLPLPVLFIDQEAEWDATIRYMRKVMEDPRVKPYWFQIPFRIFNATSQEEEWLKAWEPGKEWIRKKENVAIKDNPTKTDRFGELFDALSHWIFNGEPVAHLAGVRCEESPARGLGLTIHATYKWVTWGRVNNKKRERYAFYPLYDWGYIDIWKAIHDNKWGYCELYDYMYQYGISPKDMRVSSVTHETATKTLYFLQEIEGDLWARLTNRLKGVNSTKHLGSDCEIPDNLPFMFESWHDYRDHLLEKLILNYDHRNKMKKIIQYDDLNYNDNISDEVAKMHVKMILVNDYHGTKSSTFAANHPLDRKNSGGNRAKTDKRMGYKLS